ncbi:ABC transporter like protein [Zymoseptoria brevis]|uniref:ABC transporter like protein n=1 Tax=Zymoseptoria brevis TaxID=1047168 RepID=A0A0F4G4U9_9PEZI|nr:ABC transporter like protein [Zymoseptoria brevis]
MTFHSTRQDRPHSDVELLIMPQQKGFSEGSAAMVDVEKQYQPNSSTASQDSNVTSLAWTDLTVTVKDRTTGHHRDILHRVSGIARPGEMIALMGPSGSGKTTLLNSLAQRQKTGVTGKVLINGHEAPIATHRSLSSFVEQEDTLIGSLTVEETLRFAARLALPSTVTKTEARERARKLIDSFGLSRQKKTLIGTPVQKGISGGQKRRVSVATQLVTGPKILYLDEPTSGLDSTASYEVMSFIRNIARETGLIVIASIHQPSTKTFELFNRIILLSQGKTCYNGTIQDLDLHLDNIGMPITGHVNPAEHILDLTNVDFSAATKEDQARLDSIFEGWLHSEHNQQVEYDLRELRGRPLVCDASGQHPGLVPQVMTLLHRSFIKSYRDIVAYWIRVAMYLGLAVMMGTVWLRLGSDQSEIQPFVNAIFFGSAFMSFMAVAYVPAFLEDRSIYVKERANGIYGPTAFILSNFLIGVPYLFLISLLFSIVSYWLVGLRPTGAAFFTWVMWLFLDLLAAEALVVLISSIFPIFVVALALIAFINGLWMSVGGFLVSLPVLNVFWRYVFHYIDYQAYVFQGMMVNEFQYKDFDCAGSPGAAGGCQCMYASVLQDQCKIQGKAVLKEYGYAVDLQGQWIGIMLAIIVVYRVLGWGVCWLKKT